MKQIHDGFLRFRKKIFPQRRQLFERLAKKQTPLALFITCADSRVVPDLITQTEPGDLFICRNAGNIVPPYGDFTGGVSATIEYAVVALGVSNIIVCGHSDCGAMHGVLHPEKVSAMPTVASWLRHSSAPGRIVHENFQHLGPDDRLRVLTEENVIAQLNHLRTHPSVAARLSRGDLQIFGWVYGIDTGEVCSFDAAKGMFVRLEQGEHPSATPSPRNLAVFA